jgi:hypothetical protein
MDMSQRGSEGRQILDGWIPPWEKFLPERRYGLIHGVFLVALTETGVVTLLELDDVVNRRKARQWISQWLAAKFQRMPGEEAAAEVSFVCLLLSDDVLKELPTGKLGYAAVEYGNGSPPACPEEWRERPLSELLEIGIQELK